MDLVALLKLLLVRWYITFPVLIATVVGAVMLQMEVPREFEARGALILTTPEQDPSRSPNINSAIITSIAEMRSPQGIESVTEAGGLDTYDIERVDDLHVEVRVPGDDDAAEVTARAVMDRLGDRVVEQQVAADLPSAEHLQPRIDIDVVTAAIEPELWEVEDEPEFESQTIGTLILDDPTAGRGNPYSAGDETTRVLQLAVHSDGGEALVEERVGSDALIDFGVSAQGGPGIIAVTTMATEASVARDSFDAIHSVISEEMDRRQARADVPASRRLLVEVLAAPEAPQDVTGPVDRAVAALVALGGLLAIGLVLLVENLAPRVRAWRQRRSDRRAARTVDTDERRLEKLRSWPTQLRDRARARQEVLTPRIRAFWHRQDASADAEANGEESGPSEDFTSHEPPAGQQDAKLGAGRPKRP